MGRIYIYVFYLFILKSVKHYALVNFRELSNQCLNKKCE